jgi:VanZ family protein
MMHADPNLSLNDHRPGPLAALICLAPACALVFALLYVGAKPVAAGLIPAPWDKLAHFAVYTAITTLLLLGTRLRWPLATFCVVMLLGAGDELLQTSLPGRTADVADWLTDIAAGIITCAILLCIHNRVGAVHRQSGGGVTSH